jgi:two-component system, NarL family, invasion response regulator UvrY
MRYVLIADDHEVTRRGVRELLNEAFQDVKCTDVDNGHAVLENLSAKPWDLLIVDIWMPGPNILELLREIRMRDQRLPVLVLTAAMEAEYSIQTMKAGANGIVQKHRAADDICIAIKTVANGGAYLHAESAIAIATSLRTSQVPTLVERLSTREIEIFKGIASGKTIKELAAVMNRCDIPSKNSRENGPSHAR